MNQKKRLTIGFLADNLFDGYEGPIWSSAVNTAKNKDHNLFSFADRQIIYWINNHSYHLIQNPKIDGFISISGTLGSRSTQEEIEKFYQDYVSKPIVSIGRFVNGCTNIIVDSTGIAQLVEHLVKIHHFNKIAFISGPAKNPEAVERLQIYRTSLEMNNLKYDPNMVYMGQCFWYNDGIEAVRYFIDQQNLTLDAIIAANDYMALGAIKELQARGYHIPEDIAVVGFDDVFEAQNLKVPLTTVQQPLPQLGKIAVEKIIALIEGAPLETISLPTNIVVRKSCGCNFINKKSYHQLLFNSKSKTETLVDNTDYHTIQMIASELETKFPEIKDKLRESWAIEFVECFVKDLRTDNCLFLDLLASFVETSYEKDLSIVVWFSVLRELAILARNFDNNLITPLIAYAFSIVGEFLDKVKVHHESQTEEFFNITQRLYHIINKNQNFDTDQTEERISMDLERLGIQSFYLSRFSETDIQKAKLSYYFCKNQHVYLESIDDYFESKYLIPGYFANEERYSFIVLPIAKSGFVMFESYKFDESFHSHQNVNIYTAVKMMVLINEIRHYTSKLEYLVEERTKLLKEAEEAQQRLVETAHKAGMTEIAIGIMHNIGNLLNSINVSTEEIEDILNKSKLPGLLKANGLFKNHHQELCNLLDNQSKLRLLPEYYEQIGNQLQGEQVKISDEISQLINKITLIQGIIQTLQEYASSDHNYTFEEEVELGTVIENSLKIQESNILKHNIKIIKELNVPLFFVTNRTKLTHILVNLVKNAIEAMRNINYDPTLLIKLYLNAQSIPVIEVSDNGEGIANEDLKKMFTFGFTTKADGHGFGLHTCANYLNEMGGSISVHSDGKGKGTTFKIILNKKSEEIQ